MKTKSNLTEKKLTKAELEAREKVMKDLKKNKSALVKRYGKDAEAVMYGRATNIAKKMAESENKNRIKELVRKSLMQEADIEVGADKYEEEEKLTQASSMLDDLETKLSHHDWFYMMSDDSNKYSQGSAKEREIRDLISKLESMGYGKEAKDMYNKKEPYSRSFGHDSKLKEAKGKDMDKDGNIDSDDYLAARDAAIKKAKGEMKEDLDLGHEDNEPHMIKAELYRIGKYAMELYQMVDGFEGKGEVDFPGWWQSKITKAQEMMVSAKHYLDFELKEPAIDAMVGVASDEEILDDEAPMMESAYDYVKTPKEYVALQLSDFFRVPKDKLMSFNLDGTDNIDALTKALNSTSNQGTEMYLKMSMKSAQEHFDSSMMNEDEVTKVDKLAAAIQKALNKNKSAEDQNNIKQARKAMNDGNIEAAKKILNPYLAEKLAKQLKSK
jgi:hypothetical protein